MKPKGLLFTLSVIFPALLLFGAYYFLNASAQEDCNPGEMELVFHSGFEPGSQVVPRSPKTEDITGADTSLSGHNDWKKDFDDHPDVGEFRIYYEGGDASQRYAKIIPEPGRPDNHVLHFWIGETNVPEESKARIQADIYNNQHFKELHQTVRLYLHPDINVIREYPDNTSRLTLFEFWNDASWDNEKYPFRISVKVNKPEEAVGSNLYFRVWGQTRGKKETIWEATNTGVEVPVGQWMTVDIYIKEGNEETGKFYMAITPEGGEKQVVFDINHTTHHPDDPNPDGIAHFNPMKLYTSQYLVDFAKSKNKALQMYWDDYELWKNSCVDEP